MILAILSAILKCEWDLSYTEEALITTVSDFYVYIKQLIDLLSIQVVFVGLLIGAPVWGFIADKHGRKKVCIHVQ